MLKDAVLHYRLASIDIGQDAHFAPAYLGISPNNEIPAIVDDEAEGGPLALF